MEVVRGGGVHVGSGDGDGEDVVVEVVSIDWWCSL